MHTALSEFTRVICVIVFDFTELCPSTICDSHTCHNLGTCFCVSGNLGCNCLAGFTGEDCGTGKAYFTTSIYFILTYTYTSPMGKTGTEL